MLILERRFDQIKYYTQWLVLIRGIDEEKVAALKARHNVYFVYYLAANVDLANGQLESYQANLNRADTELKSMEATLKETLAELGQSSPEVQRPFSGTGL